MENKKKIVMFDFDGVLVNTLQFSFGVHKKLNTELTWENFQDFSNGNFHSSMDKIRNDGTYNFPSKWDEEYWENIQKITISDILNETIKELSFESILAIVSSSTTGLINKFLEKENIKKYFSDVLGTDVHKSKKVKIDSLIKKYDVIPSEMVFITDSLGDILEGNECGVKSIGVTWGIHQKETLLKGNPELIIGDPRELLGAIKNVLKL